MTQLTRFYCSTALIVAFSPQILMAEVSADDVWKNQQDYLATLGGELTSTVVRLGAGLSVSDMSLAFQLPFEIGSFKLSMPQFSLDEKADGTVEFHYPEPIRYGLDVDITGEGSFSGSIELTMLGHSMIATGEPGNITYTWSVERLDFTTKDIEIQTVKPGNEELEQFSLSGKGSFQDISGVAVIRVATMVEATSNYSMGHQEVLFTGEAENGRFNYAGGAAAVEAKTRITLPRTRMDILNLAAAFRDGLAFEVSSSTTGYHTSQITEEDGAVVGEQSNSTREQTLNYTLDRAGLKLTGVAEDMKIDVKPGKEIPFALKFSLDRAEAGVALPLMASSELQGVSYSLSLEGVEMAEDLWQLFDPEQRLPRGAITWTTNLSGKVLNKLDWLDVLTVKEVLESGEVPVEIHQLDLNELLIEMAGARLTGSGKAGFDNSDLESSGGIPKPSGVVDLVLSGGNGLLDNLVAMGLMSDQDAMGARMAVAVFTSPDPEAGDDVLKSHLEMTEDGQILANGQRIQ